jgi:hypothetical protein
MAERPDTWERTAGPTQDKLMTLSSNSQHRLAAVTDVGLLDDEHSVEPSVQAIGDVVQSIRSGAPVITR